jgi:hypothetical protein
MPVVLSALALRSQLGATVRTIAAVLFPAVAVLEDHAPELGILLYLLETALSSALLLVRTVTNLFVLRRGGATRAHGRQISQLLRARDLMVSTVVIGVWTFPLLTMAMFAVRGGEWQPQWIVLTDRARWLALTVVASAVLDTLVAPVRSGLWLQSAVAQQMTRLLVLHPVVMFGFLLYRFTGSTVGMIAIFFTLRLFVDVTGWRRASRHARRHRWFRHLADQEPKAETARRRVPSDAPPS